MRIQFLPFFLQVIWSVPCRGDVPQVRTWIVSEVTPAGSRVIGLEDLSTIPLVPGSLSSPDPALEDQVPPQRLPLENLPPAPTYYPVLNPANTPWSC